MQVKTCEVCGERAARYICQECGSEICQFCFDPAKWICLGCYKSIEREPSALESYRWSTPVKLFLLGFVLMFAGIIVIMVATVLFGASAGAGAIIWIFPLPPIGLGAGPNAFWAILLGVPLTVFALILFTILRRRAR